MRNRRHDLPEFEFVILPSLQFIGEVIVGLAHFQEIGLSISIARIVLGVILHGKFSVGILDLFHGGISGDSKHLIVVPLSLGIVFPEEISLLILDKSSFLEEFSKHSFSLFHAEFLAHLIVLMSSRHIRQCRVSLTYLVESVLSLNPVFWMFFRMPFPG